MSIAQPDVVLIVPGQGRWVYSKFAYRLEFFPFGEKALHESKAWGPALKNTRKHALRQALKLELQRQKGEL